MTDHAQSRLCAKIRVGLFDFKASFRHCGFSQEKGVEMQKTASMFANYSFTFLPNGTSFDECLYSGKHRFSVKATVEVNSADGTQ